MFTIENAILPDHRLKRSRRAAEEAFGNVYSAFAKDFAKLTDTETRHGLEAILARVAEYVIDSNLCVDDIWADIKAVDRQVRHELCLAFGRETKSDGASLHHFGTNREWNPQPWEWLDPSTIARLECLYGDHYWRGEIVGTTALGGTGKSLLYIAEALAMITGKPLLGEASRGGLKVMLMNYEDSELVLRQRVTAAMLHYKIRPEEIAGKLFVESIGSDLMRFAKGSTEGVRILAPNVDRLIGIIKRRGLDVVSLDPWVSVHEVDGNLGHLIQPVVTALKSVAQETEAAIAVAAHPRKTGGKELTQEDIAGALTLANKMRAVRTLDVMDDASSGKYGLAPWEANDFFRVSNAKHSHTRSTQPKWMRKISVGLGNGGPGLFDRETVVGVVTQWSPPTTESVVAELTPEQIVAIKAEVRAGADREDH